MYFEDVSDNDYEEKVIKICKDSDIVITSSDIEDCHRLRLGRNSTSENKRVIVTFVNRKHSELMLHLKKSISSKSKVYINNSLCPYYRFLWGKSEELQRKGKVNQVFCLGAVVTVRVTENGPLMKAFHEQDIIALQIRSFVLHVVGVLDRPLDSSCFYRNFFELAKIVFYF